VALYGMRYITASTNELSYCQAVWISHNLPKQSNTEIRNESGYSNDVTVAEVLWMRRKFHCTYNGRW